MKRYFAAAGALLLGTSTVALAADVKMSSMTGTDTAKAAADAKFATDLTATGWDKSSIAAKSGMDTEVKTDLAALDMGKAGWAGTDAKLQTASATDAKFQTWSGGDAKFASADTSAKFASAGADAKFASQGSGAKLQTASTDIGFKPANLSADAGAKLQVPSEEARAQFAASGNSEAKLGTASGDPGEIQIAMGDKSLANIGMGGPLEPASSTAFSLTPQPAAQNYPACDPGPGDDRCIQLYENGVREQLASWNRPTGGLLDQQSATAMGGPFEPVADQSLKPVQTAQNGIAKPATASASGDSSWKPVYAESELAMNGDADITVNQGESSDMALASVNTPIAPADVTDHSQFTGVGGPVEAQSGYPPCSSAGPGEDRCIQLYEAGISGSGN
jgi:hypothetical protein